MLLLEFRPARYSRRRRLGTASPARPSFSPQFSRDWLFPFSIGLPARRSSVADDGFGAHQELAEIAIVRDVRLDPVRRVVADGEVLDRRLREQLIEQLLVPGDCGEHQGVLEQSDPGLSHPRRD
jgi:hypothetical protein